MGVEGCTDADADAVSGAWEDVWMGGVVVESTGGIFCGSFFSRAFEIAGADRIDPHYEFWFVRRLTAKGGCSCKHGVLDVSSAVRRRYRSDAKLDCGGEVARAEMVLSIGGRSKKKSRDLVFPGGLGRVRRAWTRVEVLNHLERKRAGCMRLRGGL